MACRIRSPWPLPTFPCLLRFSHNHAISCHRHYEEERRVKEKKIRSKRRKEDQYKRSQSLSWDATANISVSSPFLPQSCYFLPLALRKEQRVEEKKSRSVVLVIGGELSVASGVRHTRRFTGTALQRKGRVNSEITILSWPGSDSQHPDKATTSCGD